MSDEMILDPLGSSSGNALIICFDIFAVSIRLQLFHQAALLRLGLEDLKNFHLISCFSQRSGHAQVGAIVASGNHYTRLPCQRVSFISFDGLRVSEDIVLHLS